MTKRELIRALEALQADDSALVVFADDNAVTRVVADACACVVYITDEDEGEDEE